MVFFNYALRKLNAKIVYYGPGLCGKTTNLQWIHDHFEGGQRGKMISLATEGDRTIFFDLLPIDIGSIRGMDVTLQLYTVPGQVHYNSTRQLVLRGADGVVFVADSQRTMKSSNAESFENLQENLMLQGIDLKEFPHILQFNKRDLRDLLSPEDLNESLNIFSCPIFEAIATEGIGVQESLEGIVKLVMRNLREKYEPVANAGVPQGLKPMGAAPPAAVQTEEPAAATTEETTSDPLAPDFVSQPDQPAPAAPPHPAAPPPAGIPTTVMPPADKTIDIDIDSGFSAFQDEDEVATAVYEGSDTQIAEIEASITSSAFPVDEATPASEPDTDGSEPDPSDGPSTDPRDEDGTTDDVTPDVEFGDVESTAGSEAPSSNVDVSDTDSSPDSGQESMDDLFDAEPPTVKAFIDDVMDVVETEGHALTDGDDAPLPPLVDPGQVDFGSPATDRYEDRIDAPGPFAPPPKEDVRSAEAEGPESDLEAETESETTSESDQESIQDQIRQAFGSSENREALASLSIDDLGVLGVTEKPAVETRSSAFLDDPPEVQPVAPPSPEEDTEIQEPEEIEPVEFADSPEPESFEPVEDEVDDEPSLDVPPAESDVEPVAESAEETPEDVDFESAETVVDEFAKMDPIIATPPAPEEPEETDEPEVPGEPEVVAAEPAEPPKADKADKAFDRSQPIMFGSGDPFASDGDEGPVSEVLPPESSVVSPAGAIDVTAQDNQLHVQLKGSGAIAEMGQVRALDIEVPVPGQWVGNRKVTLQLRLTLTPAEDENG